MTTAEKMIGTNLGSLYYESVNSPFLPWKFHLDVLIVLYLIRPINMFFNSFYLIMKQTVENLQFVMGKIVQE